MPSPISVHMVGGAVRDALLGLPVQDRDWVVVGATPQDMLDHGFQPVGKDFPVFLHPQSREEYALARTERKTGHGYQGFAVHAAPDVTLEQDLARRDLTINSIATRPIQKSDGSLFDSNSTPTFEDVIDPYGGVADLQNGVLRHVSDAFREDPVRILRLARFAARFPHFKVAEETTSLMQRMVTDGEVRYLVAERVWQELARGLMAAQPSRMFEVLRSCGALAVLLPELDRLWGVPQRADYHPEVDTGIHVMMVLDTAAGLNASLPVRLACLFHDLGKGTTPAHILPRHLGHEQRSAQLLAQVCERWRIPRDGRELADVVAREHGHIHGSQHLSAAALLRLLERCDALRRPERFADALQACECDARGRLGFEHTPYPQKDHLLAVLQAAQTVDAGEAARDAARSASGGLNKPDGKHIAKAVQAARESAIAAHLADRTRV